MCGCRGGVKKLVFREGRGYVNISQCIGEDCQKQQVDEKSDTNSNVDTNIKETIKLKA